MDITHGSDHKEPSTSTKLMETPLPPHAVAVLSVGAQKVVAEARHKFVTAIEEEVSKSRHL